MQYKTKKTKSNFLQADSGFTLVEMFIVISIFAVMASIVIFKFQSFNKSATLDNLSQDVALRVVEAQKTAISGVLQTPGTSITAPIYGVNFTSGITLGKKFIFFIDSLTQNNLYDTAPTSTFSKCGSLYSMECLSVTSITTGDYVRKICSVDTSGFTSCAPTSADITFQRPFPSAHIRTSSSPTTDLNKLYIELVSGSDNTLKKTIIITNLGQVRVFNGCENIANGETVCT